MLLCTPSSAFFRSQFEHLGTGGARGRLRFAPVFLVPLCADGLRALKLNPVSCPRGGADNVWASHCVWLHWFPKQSGSQGAGWHDCMSWHLRCYSTFLLGGEPCQVRCPGILPGWATWSEPWWGCCGSSWRKPCSCPVPAGALTHQCLPRPVGPQSSFAEAAPPGGPACFSAGLAHLTVFDVSLTAPLALWRTVFLLTCCLYPLTEAAHPRQAEARVSGALHVHVLPAHRVPGWLLHFAERDRHTHPGSQCSLTASVVQIHTPP